MQTLYDFKCAFFNVFKLLQITRCNKFGCIILLGNNPMVGATVAVAVAVEEAMK